MVGLESVSDGVGFEGNSFVWTKTSLPSPLSLSPPLSLLSSPLNCVAYGTISYLFYLFYLLFPPPSCHLIVCSTVQLIHTIPYRTVHTLHSLCCNCYRRDLELETQLFSNHTNLGIHGSRSHRPLSLYKLSITRRKKENERIDMIEIN